MRLWKTAGGERDSSFWWEDSPTASGKRRRVLLRSFFLGGKGRVTQLFSGLCYLAGKAPGENGGNGLGLVEGRKKGTFGAFSEFQ